MGGRHRSGRNGRRGAEVGVGAGVFGRCVVHGEHLRVADLTLTAGPGEQQSATGAELVPGRPQVFAERDLFAAVDERGSFAVVVRVLRVTLVGGQHDREGVFRFVRVVVPEQRLLGLDVGLLLLPLDFEDHTALPCAFGVSLLGVEVEAFAAAAEEVVDVAVVTAVRRRVGRRRWCGGRGVARCGRVAAGRRVAGNLRCGRWRVSGCGGVGGRRRVSGVRH